MKRLLYILFSLAGFNGFSQDLISSNTFVESCNDQMNCLKVSNYSYLYYDENKGEFYLQLDFGKFRHGVDTNDNWVNRTRDTVLYYKAVLLKENFPVLTNQGVKTLVLKGLLCYGGGVRPMDIEFTFYSTENSILSVTNTNTNLQYDNYKVSFLIPFVPKDFKQYKKLYYNDQTVNINVALGRINLLRPGMEFLVKDAYYQPSR